MYEIYIADLPKATGVKEMKRRPVVVVGYRGGKAEILKITSKYHNDEEHVHMNPWKIAGYCDTKHLITIDRKYLYRKVRPCTTGERDAIQEQRIKYIF
jgi:hypothetical protein